MLLTNTSKNTYVDSAIELQSLWNSRIEVVPLVFGALGTVHENTIKSFKLLGLNGVGLLYQY